MTQDLLQIRMQIKIYFKLQAVEEVAFIHDFGGTIALL
jgi:hypothetical protein